jgi:hypothetical protein
MEFLSGSDGPIIPDPSKSPTNEQLERTQVAMDFFRGNAERMRHFKQRVEELGRTGEDTVITLLDVDDPGGRVLADILMPGHDWQRYRDAGEIPVARGLAAKDGIPEFLEDAGYESAASELSATNDLRVVVLNSGVALLLEVEFSAQE